MCLKFENYGEIKKERKMESFQPKVSIVIPVYNGANYVKEAIDCALKQTYDNLEVIVVNDGSRDDGATEKIALSYGDRIRYFYKENGGVSSALNYGISVMEGEYFSWLSHDDLYTPSKVEDSVNLICAQEEKEKLIAYCGVNYVNEKSEVVREGKRVISPNKIHCSEDLFRLFTRGYILNGCAMLIPKKAFDECGGFDEDLRYCQDALMWYRIFFAGYKLISEDKGNVMYRLHEAQTSQTRKDLFKHDSLCLAKEVVPKLIESCEGKRELVYNYAVRNAKLNNKPVVSFCLDIAKKEHLLGIGKRMKIALYSFCGRFRGLAKKIYYKLFLRVKI